MSSSNVQPHHIGKHTWFWRYLPCSWYMKAACRSPNDEVVNRDIQINSESWLLHDWTHWQSWHKDLHVQLGDSWWFEVEQKKKEERKKMACLINTCIFRTACCLNAQCGNASPGNLWALPDSQQDVLSVNENCPTGKTEHEQNENSPLEIYSHLLKVATSVGLLKKKKKDTIPQWTEMKLKCEWKKSGVQDKSW